MSTQGELMAAEAMRNAVSAALSQGVSVKSALLYVATMGLPKSTSVVPTTLDNWRSDFGWGEASGNAYEKKILINRPTGTIRAKGGLRQRDFAEENIVDTASYSYYTIEQTYGINEDDLRLNRDNKTKIVDIRKEKRKMAEAAIHAALIQVPHYGTETGHNAGLSILSPTNVAASTTLGGIALDATDNYSNSYWRPGNYDYGNTLTIATDFFVIHDGAIDAVETSASAGGLGRVGPDFAYMDPDAWAKVMEYYNDILSMPISSGKTPSNLNMVENGFRNIVVNGVTLFPDHQTGGSTGYIDAVANEEIMYGNSKSFRFVTCNSKEEGFIRALPVVKDNAIVSGELGVFKVDPFAFVIDDPKHFGLAYT